MQAFVCGQFLNQYLVVDRLRKMAAAIPEELYRELVALLDNPRARLPLDVRELLHNLSDRQLPAASFLSDVLVVRRPSEHHYTKASYELTPRCNYKCLHCYLGEKDGPVLNTIDKLTVIRNIERSGCLWLQITGGEPLASPDFSEVYAEAFSLGLLTTISSNGSLLSRPQVAELLSECPPYRLTVSMYGATRRSYDSLTQCQGSFDMFMEGLNWARKAGLRTRLNIIVTRFNQSEVEDMVQLARTWGFEYHVYAKLIPTLEGMASPLGLMAEDCATPPSAPATSRHMRSTCMAGQNHYHVDSNGQASICAIARQLKADFVSDSDSALRKLPEMAHRLLAVPDRCQRCSDKAACTTCPPKLRLYEKSAIVPPNICSGGDTA